MRPGRNATAYAGLVVSAAAPFLAAVVFLLLSPGTDILSGDWDDPSYLGAVLSLTLTVVLSLNLAVYVWNMILTYRSVEEAESIVCYRLSGESPFPEQVPKEEPETRGKMPPESPGDQ
ncbi:MAG: hypothetical protein RBQ77_00355 [Candidatus Methanomethylophilaceae archaeon]|nr:hypothetical protein [Candidatus Methanomethylophilaceae archaeon]NLF33404.1 hypothetical protein [Thermoplasmatales archaeon]